MIEVKLFAKQFNTKTTFTVKNGEQVLNIRSYGNPSLPNWNGEVGTSVSYSLVDLMHLFSDANYRGIAAKWAALGDAMVVLSEKLNAVVAVIG